ncbi:MAG: NAD(P)-dependent oxidoreductase [Gemmatimonadaceae bacterium]|nr:NAD(P)-dependent oxidoreductase [Gemmatimonadaceae bacterium]
MQADRVGFIGLGSMGRRMVANLAGAGEEILVFDVDAAACEAVEGPGVRPVENVASVGRGCNRVLLSLPDGAVVEQVLLGAGGLAESLKAGAVVADCSTCHPDHARDMEIRLKERGIRLLDAPVTGLEDRAAAGTLTVMVGGDQAAFEEVKPLLERIGSLVVHMGAPGHGQLTKMANNVLYNISVAAMAEMLPLAVRLGLDPDKLRRVVATGSGQSFGFDYFAEHVLRGRFDEGYPMGAAFKDMVTLMERADQERAPMPVASGAMQTYRQALAEGHGDEAKGAMIKVWERVMGVAVRKKG